MNERRSVMGACEYSIESLQKIKKQMMDSSDPDFPTKWAVGGLIMTLVSSLLQISHKVIKEASKSDNANAHDDLRRIKGEFGQFMDGMIDHE